MKAPKSPKSKIKNTVKGPGAPSMAKAKSPVPVPKLAELFQGSPKKPKAKR